jgi:hypothetical protein
MEIGLFLFVIWLLWLLGDLLEVFGSSGFELSKFMVGILCSILVFLLYLSITVPLFMTLRIGLTSRALVISAWKKNFMVIRWKVLRPRKRRFGCVRVSNSKHWSSVIPLSVFPDEVGRQIFEKKKCN